VASAIRLDDTDWSEHVMRDGHGMIPLRAGSGSEYRSAWPSRCSFPMLPAGLTLHLLGGSNLDPPGQVTRLITAVARPSCEGGIVECEGRQSVAVYDLRDRDESP
jgi:hypothetical protein